ncbi:ribonuclease P protein component [Agitococcus lubricus]|uniref:Ribonuclease P protein component n=1 Tax=Agitococcus lubricus TaxID=1077255 RepID=A0A2T5J408_9GAMM|nr:ribonuclease P protein component [Agitococcus lubricus]PTQ91233.1 ribonuclease P protein component [Agitococcus lubricus]
MSQLRPYLFRPEQRLRTSASFQAVFDSPLCKVAQPQFLVLVAKNQQPKTRIGFVIARKKVRFAVERNRIKRLVRQSFRLHQYELPAVDIVFIARQGIDSLANHELTKALDKTWQQLNRRYHASLKATDENSISHSHPRV